jgi:hypothetical protein
VNNAETSGTWTLAAANVIAQARRNAIAKSCVLLIVGVVVLALMSLGLCAARSALAGVSADLKTFLAVLGVMAGVGLLITAIAKWTTTSYRETSENILDAWYWSPGDFDFWILLLPLITAGAWLIWDAVAHLGREWFITPAQRDQAALYLGLLVRDATGRSISSMPQLGPTVDPRRAFVILKELGLADGSLRRDHVWATPDAYRGLNVPRDPAAPTSTPRRSPQYPAASLQRGRAF